jgi:hypothetical protein
MKIVTIIGAAALAGATLAFTVALPAQDAKAKSQADEKGAAASASQTETMEAYMKAIAPGEQHARFRSMAGTWNTRMTHYTPGVPPTESIGTSRLELIMGDRYLIEHFEADVPMMGQFKGMAIYAFDNVTQEYVGTWIDNFDTGILSTRGTRNADGHVEVYGEFVDARGGGKVSIREVFQDVSPNERLMTMYETRGDTEKMLFELTYTREQAEDQGQAR